MASSQFRVLVGVKLGKVDVQKQLNGIKNLKVKVNADVVLTKKAQKKIKLDPLKPVKITLDTKSAEKKLNTLKKQIQELKKLGNIKINMAQTGSGSSSGKNAASSVKKMTKEVQEGYKKLQYYQQRIKSLRYELSGLDPSKDTKRINQIIKSLGNYMTKYNELRGTLGKKLPTEAIKALDNAFDAPMKATKQTIDSFNNLKRVGKELNSLRVTVSGLDQNTQEAKELNAQIKALESTYDKLQASMKGQLSTSQMSQLNADVEKATAKIAQLKAKLRDTVSIKMSNGAFSKELSQMAANLSKVQARSGTTTTAVKQVGAAFRELKAAQASGDTNAIIAAYNNYNAALTAANNQIQRNIASERRLMAAEKQHTAATRQAAAAKRLLNDKSSFDASMQIWLKNNSAAAEQFGAKVTELRNKLKTCDATELNNLKQEFAQLKKQAQIAGVTGKTFGDRLKDQLKRYSSYFSVASAFMYGTMAIRNMARAVLEVDTAMTGLLRVTEMTANQTNVMYDKMIASAKEYGRTLTDTINATADWVRAGFDADTALGLAEKTAMYQNVSDLDYDEASENLLTSFNGFKESLMDAYGGSEVEAVGHIVDVLNELDNNFSVTSAGLGEGLSRSASALQIAGNTFEESAA